MYLFALGLPCSRAVFRCVASCTAYLEEIGSGEEGLRGLGVCSAVRFFPRLISFEDPAWRQFRFSVGAPDAEAKFKAAVQEAQASNKNARTYPSLFVCYYNHASC